VPGRGLQPDGKRRIPDDSSSHKDRSCWTGLHPPSKADALCAISPRAPRLRVHRTGSRGGAKARRAGAQRSHGRLDGAAPVAGSGRLAWQGRPGQGSIYLRTAINAPSPSPASQETSGACRASNGHRWQSAQEVNQGGRHAGLARRSFAFRHQFRRKKG